MANFSIGQMVVHRRDGLAKIADTTLISDKEYFIVNTIRGSGENIYVPKERADSIIRHLLTKEEADELVEYMRTVGLDYNANTKQRRDSLKKRLSSGDVKDIGFLFKQLYLFKTNEDGTIKFGPVDVDMLTYASENLLDELTVSYDMDRSDIQDFIYSKLS